MYAPPRGARAARASDTQRKTAPFVSFWYVWAGDADATDALARWWLGGAGGRGAGAGAPARAGGGAGLDCRLARSRSALRDLRRQRVDGGLARGGPVRLDLPQVRAFDPFASENAKKKKNDDVAVAY